jgi:predicted TIM-barrel fold metal-dependent hydrolase
MLFMSDLILTDYDREYYRSRLQDFLPNKIIDCHSHVWNEEHFLPAGTYLPSRSAGWAAQVARISPIEKLLTSYQSLFPGKEVTPVIFPGVETNLDGALNNAYVQQVAKEHHLPALALTKPTMSADVFEGLIREGNFRGCKPYLNFAPAYVPKDEIRIYDFLPPAHLERLNANGWVAMLHIARPGRLGDPMNLAHLQEIDERYPEAKVIITHIGRAYDDSNVGLGMDVLQKTKNLLFDITANTNATIMRRLLEAVGPERVMFGSDLPIFAMRAHRITESGHYINVVPRGLYGDISGENTMRETDEVSALTFLLYEELDAFAQASSQLGLSRTEIEKVFYRNALNAFTIEERR